MTLKKYFPIRLVVTAAALITALAVAGPSPIGAKSPPKTHRTSYVVLDNNGTDGQTNQSPCLTSGFCPNGIRFSWTAETCYQGARFSPIAIVWTVNLKVPANTWPITIPCSTGLQLWWDGRNELTKAAWIHSHIPARAAGLAVCFQWQRQCSPGHCVVAGCIPPHVNGADIFFQGGGSLQSAEWLLNGHNLGRVAVSGAADDVFWYGHTPRRRRSRISRLQPHRLGTTT